MRIFLCILMFTSLVSAVSQKYTIQVLSMEHNASISPEFMKRVHELGLPYVKKDTEGELKVYIGEYKSKEAAESALKDIQTKISKDAFVCESKAEALTSQQKMQQAMLMAKARTLKKMKTDEVKETKLRSVEAVHSQEAPAKVVIMKKDTKTVVGMQKDIKTEEMFCKSSKKSLREYEISEALAFYRSSSYYTFKK